MKASNTTESIVAFPHRRVVLATAPCNAIGRLIRLLEYLQDTQPRKSYNKILRRQTEEIPKGQAIMHLCVPAEV